VEGEERDGDDAAAAEAEEEGAGVALDSICIDAEKVVGVAASSDVRLASRSRSSSSAKDEVGTKPNIADEDDDDDDDDEAEEDDEENVSDDTAATDVDDDATAEGSIADADIPWIAVAFGKVVAVARRDPSLGAEGAVEGVVIDDGCWADSDTIVAEEVSAALAVVETGR